MTQMESPKRKMQKKNDYQRHKLFRKIKRRRKSQAEAEQQVAVKQLRKKLKLPKFGDGKEKVNLDNAHFDKEGNLVDNTTGVKYTPTSDDVVITPNTKYFYDPYSSASNYFDGNWSKDLINMTPGVGDGMDIAQAIVDSTNGKYLTAGSSLAMLALPNFIEKPGRRLINYMPGLTKYLYNANNKVAKFARDNFPSAFKNISYNDAVDALNRFDQKLIGDRIIHKNSKPIWNERQKLWELGTFRDKSNERYFEDIMAPKLDVGDPAKIHGINISDPRLNTVIGFHPSIGVGGFKTPDGYTMVNLRGKRYAGQSGKQLENNISDVSLHESWSHMTDADASRNVIGQNTDDYKLLSKDGNVGGSSKWIEGRATMNQIRKKLYDAGYNTQQKIDQYISNLSDEQLFDLFSQQNGYGKDYQRAYNSADANTKKQMSDKARNMFKLAAIGGIGITTANKINSDKRYNSGKDIHIKKSKRGTFTKAAKQHGMSVQSFANKVLRNPSKYSADMRKKANFAHNAASWKH